MGKFDWELTIKANIVSMKLLGLWPKSVKGYRRDLYSVYSLLSLNLLINGHVFFQTLNIFFVYTDIAAVTAIIFVILTEILTAVKVYYFVRNMKQLKEIMETLKEESFLPETQQQKILVQPGLNLWKFTYIVYHFPVLPTLTAWAIYPITDGSVQEYRLPFSAWYPFNTKISPYYELTYVYQIVSVWFLAIACLNMDTLVAALMMYVSRQCEILCDRVKNLGSEGVDKYGQRLLECIIHHKKILSFSTDCNKFFDKIVLGQFITSALTLALTMFQLTLVAPLSSESYSLLFYSFSMTTEIFLYCWFGNEVELKTSRFRALDAARLGF
ncbi:hypothetical protein Zmor_007651 [Zophobas morio]|uniref:Odorant receptor n=1 Tax=Zophobas morio TaxID=2755281 RepID=A0AA38IXR0_9CUCU|nr:hypothetical protein Zmor_007651 [Zophobas morio]